MSSSRNSSTETPLGSSRPSRYLLNCMWHVRGCVGDAYGKVIHGSKELVLHPLAGLAHLEAEALLVPTCRSDLDDMGGVQQLLRVAYREAPGTNFVPARKRGYQVV